MELISGQNLALTASQLTIKVTYQKNGSFGGSDIDLSAFLLTKSEKVRGDWDFIFYNQPQSADNSVRMIGSDGFQVSLNDVHPDIEKIAFTMVIDGADDISRLQSLCLTIQDQASFRVPLTERSEKALILGQLYRHSGVWKFRASGQGYNGGLLPLAQAYGVDAVEDEPAPAQSPAASPSVSLEKKLEVKAPHLVSLVKSIRVSLEKHNLTQVKARVAFVLDASGSMTQQFKRGNVQAVLDRIAALAVQFDDDGSMEVWGFAERFKQYPDVSLDNLQGYIENIRRTPKSGRFEILGGLGGVNNEPPVMDAVIETFKGSKEPVFVVFITDGGISKAKAIKDAIRVSADYPIFWKFVGLGGHNYGILEELDNFTDRLIDNTNFFAIDDFNKMSDDDLYDLLLTEFNDWLKLAKEKGILS